MKKIQINSFLSLYKVFIITNIDKKSFFVKKCLHYTINNVNITQYVEQLLKEGKNMSRKCQISGRGPLSGNTRSHALNSSRRKWNVNLQKATILVDGKPTKVRISAKELRTLRKAG